MAEVASKATAALLAEEVRQEEQQDPSSATASPAPASLLSSWTYWAANNATWTLTQILCILDGSKFSKPSPYLLENYAPVRDETFESNLQLLDESTTIPEDLSGAFIRTGPNPYFNPSARYHWFDGDGMSHVVRFKNGTASYCNRFVDTARLREEKKAGYAAGGKIGDMKGFSGIAHIVLDLLKKKLGVLSTSHGFGTGNTALAYHAGRLLTLNEGDLPYHLKIACNGLVETIDRITFDGKLLNNKKNTRPASFTAHPKIDPKTGEMFAFAYSVENEPFLWFTRIDPSGTVVADFPVPGLRGPIMMHDFALTQNHVIFIDAPLFFKPEAMIKKGTLPFDFDKTVPLRLGVMRRDLDVADKNSVTWFTLDPGMCFHVANAWEVENTNNKNAVIEVYLCTFKDFSLDQFTAISADAEPHLTRVTLNLNTGEAVSTQLLDLCGDFPTVPVSLVARPTRYAYVATFNTSSFGSPVFYGVAKVDLTASGAENATVGLIEHGEGRVGGECYFVPRQKQVQEKVTTEESSEDDGYLVTYVYDETKKESECVVYDAKTMSSTPVARVNLAGHRVPYGFHCTWVTEEQLKNQI
jgi:carotenoid cleavage dioxygenase-like enzyme